MNRKINFEILEYDNSISVEITNKENKDFFAYVEIKLSNEKGFYRVPLIIKKLCIEKTPKISVDINDIEVINLVDTKEINISSYSNNLFDYIQKDDFVGMMCAIHNGGDVNLSNPEDGFYPIHQAVLAQNVEMIEHLLKLNVDINIRDNHLGSTSLHLACGQGYIDIVEFLVKSGADINCKNTDADITPLHLACYNGYFDIVEFLVKSGADVNLRDKDGCTPLYDAIDGCHIEIVEFLVKSGAYVNERNIYGYSPLHISVSHGHIEMAKYFTHLKFIPDMIDFFQVPETWGIVQIHKSTQKKYTSMLKYLTHGIEDQQNNEDFDFSNIEIYKVDSEKYLNISEFLIKNNSILNSQDECGFTPLHLACILGHVKETELLLSKGANTEILDSNSNTAIDLAQKNINYEIMGLISKSKDLN